MSVNGRFVCLISSEEFVSADLILLIRSYYRVRFLWCVSADTFLLVVYLFVFTGPFSEEIVQDSFICVWFCSMMTPHVVFPDWL